MKSIQRRFQQIAETNPNWSSYLCFAEAIREQEFKPPAIRKWFNRLVDKGDYLKTEKKAILKFLFKL